MQDAVSRETVSVPNNREFCTRQADPGAQVLAGKHGFREHSPTVDKLLVPEHWPWDDGFHLVVSAGPGPGMGELYR